MDDLSRRVDALSARLRLQTLVTFGALAVLVFATGGADVVAKSLVAVDGWTVRTRNAGGVLTDRLNVTTDLDKTDFQVKNSNVVLQNSNLFLEKTLTQPFVPAPANEGALWYDDTSNALKMSNGSAWVGPGLRLLATAQLGANAQNLTCDLPAGITGNTEGHLFAVLRFKSTASGQIRLRPRNAGITVSGSTHLYGVGDWSTGTFSDNTSLFWTTSLTPGTSFHLYLWIRSKTAETKTVTGIGSVFNASVFQSINLMGKWSDVSGTTGVLNGLALDGSVAGILESGASLSIFSLSEVP